MNFNLEEFRLLPEDSLHALSLKTLRSQHKKLEKRMSLVKIIDKQNSIKGTQTYRLEHMEMQLKDLHESMVTLSRDQEVRAKRARLRIV